MTDTKLKIIYNKIPKINKLDITDNIIKYYNRKIFHSIYNNCYISSKLKTNNQLLSTSILQTMIIDENFKPYIKLYDMHFISQDIILYLEKECDKFAHVVFYNNINNITFDLFLTWSSHKINNDYINNLLNNIISITTWISTFNKNINNTNKKIHLILCPFEKSYDPKNHLNFNWSDCININKKEITPMHINSGVSTGNELYIYRIEELCKVLIHELIHNFNLDIHEFEDEFKNIPIYFGNNKYPILINEAYTEYIAILLISYYKCHINNTQNYNAFKHIVKKEYYNSQIACYQLFKFYNITDLTTLLTQNTYNQQTNAFSYIFIKYILLKLLVCHNNIFDFNFYNKNKYLCSLLDKFDSKCIIVNNLNDILTTELSNISNYNYLITNNKYNKKISLSIDI